jgi:hypothetical protein
MRRAVKFRYRQGRKEAEPKEAATYLISDSWLHELYTPSRLNLSCHDLPADGDGNEHESFVTNPSPQPPIVAGVERVRPASPCA